MSQAWLRAVVVALIALGAPSALALDPPSPADAQGSAPPTHQPTGLTFPLSIAGVPLLRSIDYARTENNPGLGFGYSYGIPGRLLVTAYVYDAGQPVQEGNDSPAVAAAFDESLRNIHVAARQIGKYHDLRIVQAPTTCAYGTMVFRCTTLSAISADGTQPLYVKLLLTGYRRYFLKLRIDWRQNEANDTAEVERVVQTFVGAALR